MRKNRLLRDGARYHVTARVNNREFLMKEENAKSLFLKILKKAQTKFSFRLDNFVVMENHVHLIIKPEGAEKLSRIMQWILSVFAMTYNRRFGRTGHFWGTRFFSRIINSLRQYLIISHYIDDNPVRSGLADKPVNWKFGGAWYRRRKKRRSQDPSPHVFSIFRINRKSLDLPRLARRSPMRFLFRKRAPSPFSG
jgi:Transposase and inactivated derivatives